MVQMLQERQGTAVNPIPDYVRPGGKSYVSPEGIIYCTDGKMRWVHEIDQRKNPTVLWGLLWKYVGACAILGVLIMLVQAGTGGVAALLASVPVVACLLLAGAVLAAVSYGTRRLQNGPFVCLVYTLDEQTVTCQQVKGKSDKEKVTHAFAVWVGGQSQPAVRVSSLREGKLSRLRGAVPARNRIRLCGVKGVKSVRVEPQQVEPVLDWLKAHCPVTK